jgi:hypothetical protein
MQFEVVVPVTYDHGLPRYVATLVSYGGKKVPKDHNALILMARQQETPVYVSMQFLCVTSHTV